MRQPGKARSDIDFMTMVAKEGKKRCIVVCRDEYRVDQLKAQFPEAVKAGVEFLTPHRCDVLLIDELSQEYNNHG